MSGWVLWLACEGLQIDRCGHCLVARAVRMQVISAIKSGKHVVWLGWIANGHIEIHDAVECARLANPCIDRLSLCLAGGSVIRPCSTAKRRQGRAIHLDAPGVCSRNQRLHTVDDLLVAQLVFFCRGGIRIADVVDAFQQYDPADARLFKRIPIESRQGTWTETFVQNAVTPDPGVRHSDGR